MFLQASFIFLDCILDKITPTTILYLPPSLQILRLSQPHIFDPETDLEPAVNAFLAVVRGAMQVARRWEELWIPRRWTESVRWEEVLGLGDKLGLKIVPMRDSEEESCEVDPSEGCSYNDTFWSMASRIKEDSTGRL